MKNKIQYFENLRLLALILIVIIHATTPLIHFDIKTGLTWVWWFGNIIWVLCLFAVPVLFMQSGALLLSSDKKESTPQFLKRRLWKILLPFITWSFIYSSYAYIADKRGFQEIIYTIISSKLYFHFWFVYVLIGLYFATPIFRIYIKHSSVKNIQYLLLLWFFVTGINPAIKKIIGFDIGIKIDYLYGYIGYFILGYYLHSYSFSKTIRWTYYALGILSFLSTLLLTAYLTMYGKEFNGLKTDQTFHDYKMFPIILYSSAVFIWAKNSKFLNSFDVSFGGKINIGRICYGVYLSHVIVMLILIRFTEFKVTIENPVWTLILQSSIILVTCFGIFITLELLQRYSIIRKISKLLY